MAPGLSASALDWQQPWFQPLARTAAPPWPALGEGAGNVAIWLNRQCSAPSPVPVRFVSQAELPPGVPYEQFIHAHGRVPTRDNLHDLFNGLIWLHYPSTKRLLNRWQAQAIAMQGIGAVRGPLRDAITVWDENGAVLDAPEPLWQALIQRQWRRLFVDLRPLWAQARLLIVGHALLEQLAQQPRKNLTAHVLRPAAPLPAGADVDAWLAKTLQAEHLTDKPFVPLPVLGIPGWCEGNADFCFYDDPHVFRAASVRPKPLQRTEEALAEL